ncbi:ADP-ribosylglycohydrolase family protein [Streptomyces boninensis]|uniref:ADP-ribosylglycohydrolase family protein n=1 Tax=Streptomyces boninensis TaxID=2039455 RepID=UPI003B224236
MTADHDTASRLARALASLRGLSVGDALGAQLSTPGMVGWLRRRELPPGPWRWTDDTEMACAVVAELAARRRIGQDELAALMAEHRDPERDYGSTVSQVLDAVRAGDDWRTASARLFKGRGSWGNGAASRVAPLGAWYAGDAAQAVHQAEISAYVTHQHREAVVGAMAVAAAAALAGDPDGPKTGAELLDGVTDLIPRSAVGQGVRRARDMLDYADSSTVAAVLGSGRRTSAQDTVPYALWAVARSLGDWEETVRVTARAGGDVDTTCAIAGGVAAARAGGAPPADWEAETEPLPGWVPGSGS